MGDLGEGGVRIHGEYGYDYLTSLAPCGDFNADGLADLLVSGWNLNAFPARVYVVLGGPARSQDLSDLGSHGLRIFAGSRAEPVGGTDFDGDGFDDAVVWADGSLYVVYGNAGSGSLPEGYFLRGDANQDGTADISDAVSVLGHLFLGEETPPCLDAADANDDGAVDISDAIYLLGFLFLGADQPPAPYPTEGADPTPDTLACRGS
jgi:hypothetical protein